MKKNKIVHIMHNEKFIAPFIEFIKNNFNFDEHFFILVGGVSEDIAVIPQEKNVLFLDQSYLKSKNYFKLSKTLKEYTTDAKKIIFHAILDNSKLYFLFFNRDLFKKSFWVIWGGDLYMYNKPRKRLKDKWRHIIRKNVFSNIGHIVTYLKGDFELAQKWYSAKGVYCECLMYTSNLYKQFDIEEKKDTTTYIQVGNSAVPTNYHIEIFDMLKKYVKEDIKIIVPLSYGNKEYSKEVIEVGKKIFNQKIEFLTDFMPFEEYLSVLSKIDIAIFNHDRQQAMGNIITLLGLGKKVYIRDDVSTWNFFKNLDIKVFDVKNIQLNLLDKEVKTKNEKHIKDYFSVKVYKQQLENMFEMKL